MSAYDYSRCSTCGATVRVRIETDGTGRTVDVPEQMCACERKRRGICKHCDRPVWGVVRKAIYCTGHRKLVSRRQSRVYAAQKYKRDPDRWAAVRRENYWSNPERERQRKRDAWQAQRAA